MSAFSASSMSYRLVRAMEIAQDATSTVTTAMTTMAMNSTVSVAFCTYRSLRIVLTLLRPATLAATEL